MVRWALTIAAVGFLAVFLVVPVALVFSSALAQGLGAYVRAVSDTEPCRRFD
jgi:sulfate transport system permease protein